MVSVGFSVFGLSTGHSARPRVTSGSTCRIFCSAARSLGQHPAPRLIEKRLGPRSGCEIWAPQVLKRRIVQCPLWSVERLCHTIFEAHRTMWQMTTQYPRENSS